MSDIRLNLVVIRSAELDRAGKFYESLGLKFVKHAHGKGPEHLACEWDGMVFEIYPLADKASPTTGVRLGFRVKDVDEVFEKAIQAGGTMVSAPALSSWGRRAVVSDVDGHRVELSGENTAAE